MESLELGKWLHHMMKLFRFEFWILTNILKICMCFSIFTDAFLKICMCFLIFADAFLKICMYFPIFLDAFLKNCLYISFFYGFPFKFLFMNAYEKSSNIFGSFSIFLDDFSIVFVYNWKIKKHMHPKCKNQHSITKSFCMLLLLKYLEGIQKYILDAYLKICLCFPISTNDYSIFLLREIFIHTFEKSWSGTKFKARSQRKTCYTLKYLRNTTGMGSSVRKFKCTIEIL